MNTPHAPGIIRIVNLTFKDAHIEDFEKLFAETGPKVRQFPGCLHLELWQDADTSSQFATCSHWVDAEALEAYRNSAFFRATWSKVKSWFEAPPRAASFHLKSRP